MDSVNAKLFWGLGQLIPALAGMKAVGLTLTMQIGETPLLTVTHRVLPEHVAKLKKAEVATHFALTEVVNGG